MISVALASMDRDIIDARNLMRHYSQWTGIDLCFKSFAAELNKLPDKYVALLGAPRLRCIVH